MAASQLFSGSKWAPRNNGTATETGGPTITRSSKGNKRESATYTCTITKTKENRTTKNSTKVYVNDIHLTRSVFLQKQQEKQQH